jgi:hypothetical protein
VAITCRKDRGPSFGFVELSAFNEPFNKENACRSWTNEDVYNIPRNSEGINMLTNQKCNSGLNDRKCEFTISEIEVWGVTFKD